MILTYPQLEALIEARGGTPQEAQVGAAIEEAESSGNTEAWGDRSLGPGGGQYAGSLGTWQIFGQAHPDVSASCAEDANCATDAARQISNNWTDWSPWSTFNSGAYRQFLSGQPADATQLGVTVPNPVNVAEDLGSKIGNFIHLVQTHGNVPSEVTDDLLVRLGLFALGAALVLIGVVVLFRPTATAAVGVVTGRGFQQAAGR